jgi:uncharacterized RDD family membrane protein YckC
MYCTRCGNTLTEDAAFCRRCGQAVGQPPAGAQADASPAIPSTPEHFPISPVETFLPPTAAPSPSPVFLPYAGFWLRLVAYFVDKAILSIAFGAIIAIAIAFVGWDRIRQARPGILVQLARFDNLSAVVQKELAYGGQFNFFAPVIIGAIVSVLLAMMIVTWLYYALMESSAKQGTIGKIAIGLIVVDASGQRVSFGRASGRFFARIITGLIPLFIGYIMAGFTEKKQALHDILAGCLVLRKN